jgi:hypothetical protein
MQLELEDAIDSAAGTTTILKGKPVKTKVINLYGGSGIGKSTTAACLYAEMKYRGINCELVREFVKDWAWEGKPIGQYDQLYILGQQIRAESILYGKVDYIITDSPLLLSPIYEMYYKKPTLSEAPAIDFIRMTAKNGIERHDYILKRNREFDPRGRYETAEMAKEVDQAVYFYLDTNEMPWTEIDCADRDRPTAILKDLGIA